LCGRDKECLEVLSEDLTGRRPCETLEWTWDCHIKIYLKERT